MKNHEKKVARIIITNPDGSFVLSRRPNWSKQAPNKLALLGGKFEPDDLTRKHAAQRETFEELGLNTEVGKFLFFMTSENNGWITFTFILKLTEEYHQESLPDHGEFESLESINPNSILSLIEQEEIAFDHPQILKKYLDFIANLAT